MACLRVIASCRQAALQPTYVHEGQEILKVCLRHWDEDGDAQAQLLAKRCRERRWREAQDRTSFRILFSILLIDL